MRISKIFHSGVGDLVKTGGPGPGRRSEGKHFGDARPGSATIIVKALVVPEWLIEIEAVAAKKG